MPGGAYFFDKLPTIGAHISMAAQAEGRYLQLRPGKTEEYLIKALTIPKPADSVRALTPLVQAEPHYWAAHETIGQRLNDSRLPAAAKSHLESALSLKPWSGRSELELARSCFQLGDKDEAQRMIEGSIKRTRDFLPAWKALLRLCIAVQSPDAQAVAAEARLLFPRCYTVALIVTELGNAEQQAEALLSVIEEFAPIISDDERFLARPEFARAVRSFVRRWPGSPHNSKVLERACELFPDSAYMAVEAAADARVRGDFTSELLYQRKLYTLFHNAEAVAKDIGALDKCPVMWDVAHFLLRIERTLTEPLNEGSL
jgi:tetratricopeptide (TPR) repeat protein